MKLTSRADSGPSFKGPDSEIASADLWKVLSLISELNAENDPDALLEKILDSAVSLTGAERGFIILSEDHPGDIKSEKSLKFRCARNLDKEKVSKPKHKISHGIVRDVLRSGRMAVYGSALNDPFAKNMRSVREQRLRSVICAPLTRDEAVEGAIYLDNRHADQIFGRDHSQLMEVFAAQASLALKTAKNMQLLDKQAKELALLNEELSRHNDQNKEIIRQQQDQISALDRELVYAREHIKHPARYHRIKGESEALRKALSLVDSYARHDETVLITGETGTGKELFARALHEQSRRRHKPFVVVDCSKFSSADLLESELFGHLKGSWTGASSDRSGLFQTGHTGTVFLDEIGEMPLGLQAKLLRVLQEQELRPMGSDKPRKIDVRVLAATNRDLEAEVENKTFRSDLFYRLKVLPLELPALRHRQGDIAVLAMHFIDDFARKNDAYPAKRLTRGALKALEEYHWPGNIRELQNEIRRACAIGGDTLATRDFQRLSGVPRRKRTASRDSGSLKRDETSERGIIVEALRSHQGHVRRAAKTLGVHHSTLYRKLNSYNIDPRNPR